MKKEHRVQIFLNTVSVLAVISINALANILPINGVQTGQVSRDFDTLFTPSGFTFSIWSIIYLGQLAFVVFSARFFSAEKRTFLTELKHIIWINGSLNIGWILAWHHYRIGLSVLVMLGLLVTLVMINLKLNDSRKQHKASLAFLLCCKVPFSIYMGWIVVATAANFAVYLTFIDWQGFGQLPEFWLAILILIGTSITCFLILNHKELFAGLAVAWGLYGISDNLIRKNEDEISIYLTYLMIAVLLLSIALKIWKPKIKLTF